MVGRRQPSKHSAKVTAQIETIQGGRIFRVVSIKNAPDLKINDITKETHKQKTVRIGDYIGANEVSQLSNGYGIIEYTVKIVKGWDD